jgi:hypothetical protein
MKGSSWNASVFAYAGEEALSISRQLIWVNQFLIWCNEPFFSFYLNLDEISQYLTKPLSFPGRHYSIIFSYFFNQNILVLFTCLYFVKGWTDP